MHICGSGYSPHMLAKLSLIKPLVVGGAVAAAIAVTPVAAAEAFAAGTATGTAATHVVFKQDPPGGGGSTSNWKIFDVTMDVNAVNSMGLTALDPSSVT